MYVCICRDGELKITQERFILDVTIDRPTDRLANLNFARRLCMCVCVCLCVVVVVVLVV